MMTVSQIIDALGGTTSVARKIAVKGASTVSEWKRTGNIPVRYWPALITAAQADGVDVDERVLFRAHVQADATATDGAAQ